jgi:haloacetate dehalogenase
MWRRVAERLQGEFSIVAPDLRGYGGSSKPTLGDGPEPFSKRQMAEDMVALMRALGWESFAVAGHDRGARVGYRLALDHPEAVQRLAVLDIVPTSEVWARADAAFAMGYWHWLFLAQPYPIPEKMIGHDPPFFFFEAQFQGVRRHMEPAAVAEYLEHLRNPLTVHAICQDYRAGATLDRENDESDRAGSGRRIECPLLVLWGKNGALPRWYDVEAIWRSWATSVTAAPIDAGHFLAEERPVETAKALADFFRGTSP